MLDKGEYLGNFVICKENSVLNDDFSWTVYQNDQLRSLFNRTTREGKRLFCKVDQIGISEAYEQVVTGYDKEEVVRETKLVDHMLKFTYGVFLKDKDGKDVGNYRQDYIKYRDGTLRDNNSYCSELFNGRSPVTLNSVAIINGETLEEIIAQFNRGGGWRYAGLSLSLGKNNTEITFTVDPSKWTNVPEDAVEYSLWYVSEHDWDRWFAEDCALVMNKKKLILTGKKPINEPMTWTAKLRTVIIPNKTYIETVPIPLVGSAPITTETIYWYHPDFIYNSLNLTPISGMCYNNQVTTYYDDTGTFYELVQMSSHPAIKFFHYTTEKDENGWATRQPVFVSDFHIQLSFYKYPGEFCSNKMKYIGNFIIGSENTHIDREHETMEVYQNDKVRALLDKTNKKGKKLYAQIDQIAFEQVERKSHYRITIQEFWHGQFGKGTKYRICRHHVLVETSHYDNDLWTAISDALNDAKSTDTRISISWRENEGWCLVYDNVPDNKEDHTLDAVQYYGWEITFDKDLQEDYNLPHIIRYNDKNNVTEQQNQDRTWRYEYKGGQMLGRNATFNTNHMYFYHPDFVGDNCNLEPITIACSYPGVNQYKTAQRYFIRSLSAPTYIQFFYWTTEFIDNEWKHIKKRYLPANFHVSISFYEDD